MKFFTTLGKRYCAFGSLSVLFEGFLMNLSARVLNARFDDCRGPVQPESVVVNPYLGSRQPIRHFRRLIERNKNRKRIPVFVPAVSNCRLFDARPA